MNILNVVLSGIVSVIISYFTIRNKNTIFMILLYTV